MAILDEIKEQQKKVADMTLKEKWNYFWDYYKVHTIVGIVALLLIVFFVKDLVTGNQDSVFMAAIVNSEISTMDENAETEFASYLQIDPKKEKVVFDNSYQIQLDSMDQGTMAATQKMVANAQLAELDVIIGPEEIIDYYGGNQFLGDIRSYLTEEQFARFDEEKRIVYVKGEDGKEYPGGIMIDDSSWIAKNGLYSHQKAVLGCVENSTHKENIQSFITYLYQ